MASSAIPAPQAAAEQEDRSGVISDGPAVEANRRLNAWSIVLPLAGTLIAILLIPFATPTAATAALFAMFFVLELVGLGIGIHRYFTHRAFKTGRVFRAVLAVTASWAFQGPLDRWVADHRRHHRFADEALDPHSPHWVQRKPAKSRLSGLFHAHIGWMFTCDLSDPDRYAADIRSDPISNWCSRHYWQLCGVSVALPAICGFLVGGAEEALLCLLWAGFVRVALLQQLTWSVNSVGHSFGHRRSGSRDESRDIPFFAIVLFGEGLHNFHHRHPTAGLNEPASLDLNGAMLRALERAGIVWSLRRPSANARRAEMSGAGTTLGADD